jgi:hypothetical protein
VLVRTVLERERLRVLRRAVFVERAAIAFEIATLFASSCLANGREVLPPTSSRSFSVIRRCTALLDAVAWVMTMCIPCIPSEVLQEEFPLSEKS